MRTLLAAAVLALTTSAASAHMDYYGDDPPVDKGICAGIDSCTNATIAPQWPIPPCPAKGTDASPHSWQLWKANFPSATQCIYGGASGIGVADVPGK